MNRLSHALAAMFVLCLLCCGHLAKAQGTWAGPTYGRLGEAEIAGDGSATSSYTSGNVAPFTAISLSYTSGGWGSLVVYYAGLFTYSGDSPAPAQDIGETYHVTGHYVLFPTGPFASYVNNFHRTGGTLPQLYDATQLRSSLGNPNGETAIAVYWTLENDTNADGYADSKVTSSLL